MSYPTYNGDEADGREPDMTLQEYYQRLLKALALDNREEFDRLSRSYLVGNRGVYLIMAEK